MVTAGTYSGGTTSGTAGTVLVTFSTAVSVNQTADYVYSAGGVAMHAAAPVGGSPSTTWVLVPANGSTLTAASNTDTLTYTQASPTSTNATYAAAGSGQVFETSGDSVFAG